MADWAKELGAQRRRTREEAAAAEERAQEAARTSDVVFREKFDPFLRSFFVEAAEAVASFAEASGHDITATIRPNGSGLDVSKRAYPAGELFIVVDRGERVVGMMASYTPHEGHSFNDKPQSAKVVVTKRDDLEFEHGVSSTTLLQRWLGEYFRAVG